jgi:hypothetical protein
MSLDLLQLEQNTENREDPFIDDDNETDNEVSSSTIAFVFDLNASLI